MKLTDSQQQAIQYAGHNLQLIACAGSGKTEVVARRVAHLLTNGGCEKLEPRNIVAFTFTNKAAAELKERIVQKSVSSSGRVKRQGAKSWVWQKCMSELFTDSARIYCRQKRLSI